MTIRYFALGLLAAFMATAAHAAEIGPYIGAGAGYADVTTDDDEDDIEDFLNAQGIASDVDNDSDNLNWRAFAGYQFTTYFGFETAYVGLGDVEVTATELALPNRRVEITTETWGIEFAATGAYPMAPGWDLTAKVGGMYYDADAEVEVNGPIAGTFDADDSGVAFTGGVGFTRTMGTNWMWRGGWQYVDVDEINHLLTTSIGYRFGN